MIGTLINVATIVVGGVLGTILGGRLPERLSQTVVSAMGLFTLALAIQMFLKTNNALVVLGSLVIGSLLGEWWQIENGLRKIGVWLESKVYRNQTNTTDQKFIRGFMTASLVFCVGPMAILGSIENGLTGNFQTLAVKAILDGFFSLAFASTLGIGVVFSSLMILVYQGGITLMAGQVQAIMTPAMMNEMSAAGGVILMGVAVGSLLELR
ncbi:MAG: DUF554 domain-containing protein, partial [Anaerolineaceae bacterium]|nr:DUF554 domain-containing protein [Anaerolineaceae bacterium]